eukprot:4016737-Prymnesium_polylepis.1
MRPATEAMLRSDSVSVCSAATHPERGFTDASLASVSVSSALHLKRNSNDVRLGRPDSVSV